MTESISTSVQELVERIEQVARVAAGASEDARRAEKKATDASIDAQRAISAISVWGPTFDRVEKKLDHLTDKLDRLLKHHDPDITPPHGNGVL